MTKYVHSGGAWRPVAAQYVKDGGAWKAVTNEYVKSGGAWKAAYTSYRGDFLVPFDGGFADVISGLGGSAINGASIDTSVYKYGGGSLKLVRSSEQYVSYAASAATALFQGDSTIQCWINPSSVIAGTIEVAIFNKPSAAFWLGNTGLRLVGGNGALSVQLAASTWVPSANTWHHVAATRSGNTYRIYANGSKIAETTDTTTIGGAEASYVGAKMFGGNDRFFDGRIDDLQICIGTAIYTGGTYTVPSAPL